MTNAPKGLHERGLELLVKGDTAGGITDLKAYLAEDPDDARAWLALGSAYLAVSHTVDAVRALSQAVELDRESVDGRLAYARALVLSRKLDDAAFQLLQAEKLAPDDARVMKDLGLVFYDKRLFEKAARWLRKASDASPNDGRAAYALGLAEEARKDMGAAVAAYREALRREPRLVDARKTLADALAAMGEHEGAIRELDAVLAEQRDEQTAQNREILMRALAEMRRARLLGKGRKELEASALVSEGGFRKKGETPQEGGTALRYGAPLVELYATLDAEGTILELLLVLTDPARASKTEDDTFKVTVVAEDGRNERADFGTAVTLTFLREAVGCPMTQASALYGKVLGSGGSLEWGGVRVGWKTVPHPDKAGQERHGMAVSAAGEG